MDESVGIRRGEVFRLIGNDMPCLSREIGWLGKTGRPPTDEEKRRCRAPLNSESSYTRTAPPEPEDDELDAEAAIALARLEQERRPTDLIGANLAA